MFSINKSFNKFTIHAHASKMYFIYLFFSYVRKEGYIYYNLIVDDDSENDVFNFR